MINPRLLGAGLGLRREHFNELLTHTPDAINFFEIAPENWMGLGGKRGRSLRQLTEQHPFVCHGLTLSLGGFKPLDELFLHSVKTFLHQHQIALYTEHLSYCSDHAHLYDLLPIPFTEEAVKHVAARIRRTQDILERRIAVENASYYLAAPVANMDELNFILAVLAEADCDLHLDVNNVYVNSVNHGFDPVHFIQQLPAERIVYVHTAGHYQETPNLIIDTHGADVIEPVWDLLATTYQHCGVVPTLLERDLNIPPLDELLPEVQRIADYQRQYAQHQRRTA
ncbi:MAG: DUF692 domain-containing protein [Sulfuriferula sp.]|nr:DUF692 domain-containing protein [Sulfuriferula sp.]